MYALQRKVNVHTLTPLSRKTLTGARALLELCKAELKHKKITSHVLLEASLDQAAYRGHLKDIGVQSIQMYVVEDISGVVIGIAGLCVPIGAHEDTLELYPFYAQQGGHEQVSNEVLLELIVDTAKRAGCRELTVSVPEDHGHASMEETLKEQRFTPIFGFTLDEIDFMQYKKVL